MKEALIILGDQLFPVSFYVSHKKIPIFMAEDLGLCTHYKYHKHKIIFFLSAMRTYRDELLGTGYEVSYHEFSDVSFVKRLEDFLKKKKVEKIYIPEIQDKFFEDELFRLFEKLKLSLEVLPSPMFLSTRENFKKYLSKTKKPFMKTFYEGERKRLNILIDKHDKPEGGQWSYDLENRKKAPKNLDCKKPISPETSSHVKEVSIMVDRHFKDHPGRSANFWLPIDRAGAFQQLRHFIKHHLYHFGEYQDAITNRSPFLYHSVISPAMNAGLITPKEVIDEVLKARKKDADIPLASVEGFVRQVIGWREFVRGIYQNFSEEEEKRNFFNHNRKLTKHWYEGTTGLPPVDDAIKKALDYGYCHHIDRLMVLSNVMLISEIHPHEVHRWFMEMFVDSADWVMGPNVYGMGQFSDGGIFATKPYFSGSNYVLKMSDYKKGDWCDVWDGLFWRFISNNKNFFMKNHRLNMMVKLLEKMEPARKRSLMGLAEEFIQSKTK